jgi:hypothetical protein
MKEPNKALEILGRSSQARGRRPRIGEVLVGQRRTEQVVTGPRGL